MSRFLLATTLALTLPTLAGAQTLTLYTSQPNEDAQKTVDAFTAANPDITVEWVRDGTTKLMARVAAETEAGQPQADVLLISDTVTLEGMAQAGQLALQAVDVPLGALDLRFQRSHTVAAQIGRLMADERGAHAVVIGNLTQGVTARGVQRRPSCMIIGRRGDPARDIGCKPGHVMH